MGGRDRPGGAGSYYCLFSSLFCRPVHPADTGVQSRPLGRDVVVATQLQHPGRGHPVRGLVPRPLPNQIGLPPGPRHPPLRLRGSLLRRHLPDLPHPHRRPPRRRHPRRQPRSTGVGGPALPTRAHARHLPPGPPALLHGRRRLRDHLSLSGIRQRAGGRHEGAQRHHRGRLHRPRRHHRQRHRQSAGAAGPGLLRLRPVRPQYGHRGLVRNRISHQYLPLRSDTVQRHPRSAHNNGPDRGQCHRPGRSAEPRWMGGAQSAQYLHQAHGHTPVRIL
mmetsp:Transcript_37667/g.73783  ORF Transcript_37667/g.73783 Transcript_37667/m.73783 type:complete len:276 (-) Transcript_37667:246-1073(-)